MLEVLDSLRRLLDSPQRILSHVRLDSTHGTSRTAMPADERKRRRAAAEKARRVRLRQAVSAAETAAAQNEPLADEQQRVLATPAPHTPPITSSAKSKICVLFMNTRKMVIFWHNLRTFFFFVRRCSEG